jgi:hypothetical protein
MTLRPTANARSHLEFPFRQRRVSTGLHRGGRAVKGRLGHVQLRWKRGRARVGTQELSRYCGGEKRMRIDWPMVMLKPDVAQLKVVGSLMIRGPA